MATIEETVSQDAAANAGTAYAMSAGDTFEGTFGSKADEDWIRINLIQGETYEINLAGAVTDTGADTILKIFNSAGEQVAYNDDVDLATGKLYSMVTFSPDATGVYYISASTYRGNPNKDYSGEYMVTVVDEKNNNMMQEVEDPDIEHIPGSGHDDILVGTPGRDKLDGLGGNDDLDGREDDDILAGGGGADRLRGGPGEDAASYRYSYAGVEVRLHDGITRGGHAEGDTFVGRQTIEYVDADGNTREADVPDIEHLTGSEYDDILVGTHGRNSLDGRGGSDRLNGGGGNDELDGGAGNDWLIGGAGADMLRGGAGEDFALYWYSDAGVTVRLHTVLTRGGKGGHAEGDTYVGTETVEYTDAENNTLTLTVPDIEHLVGSDYNDILAGDGRDNWLDGSGGDDRLYGGPDGGDDVLAGGEGDDRLYGGKGNDTLEGGPGNDQLRGGRDNDRLDGGEGDDTFFFSPGGEDDIILDFGNGEDKIDLTAFADIESVADLTMQQQSASVIIDLAANGGGTVTLRDFNIADILDEHFVFFVDDTMMMA